MKIRNVLFVLILTINSKHLFAQNYPPINDSSAWYMVINNFLGNSNFWIVEQKDTLISSHIYKKYVVPNVGSVAAYIRDDISAKKIYRYIFNNDELMCDFTLHLGDSIILGNGQKYKVIIEDSVNVALGKRRRLTLKYQASPFSAKFESWIEGVGNEAFPVKPNYDLPSDPVYSILCSYQRRNKIINNGGSNCPPPPPALPSVETTPTSTLGLNSQGNFSHIEFSPNPFSYQATISIENNLTDATMIIYNIIGKECKKIEHILGKTILLNRDNLPEGLYFILLNENTRNLISNYKFIIAD
jgi:hypothetical protein